MKRFDRAVGKFTPLRRDDLRPGAEALIGRSTLWEAMWVVTDGEYAGDWAMAPCGEDSHEWSFVWAPSRDITFTDINAR